MAEKTDSKKEIKDPAVEKIEKPLRRTVERLDKISKEWNRSLDDLNRRLIRPLPLKWRIPAVMLGALLVTGGITLAIYFLTRDWILYQRVFFLDYLFMAASILISFLGYTIAHKALEGAWL